MTTKEMIEILQAYERGEEIEWMDMECGYKWHTLEKNENYNFNFGYTLYRIKIPRWRAQKGESYYYLTSELIVRETSEESYFVDSERYNVGNYFKTEEEAQRAADYIKESLIKFHEEND